MAIDLPASAPIYGLSRRPPRARVPSLPSKSTTAGDRSRRSRVREASDQIHRSRGCGARGENRSALSRLDWDTARERDRVREAKQTAAPGQGGARRSAARQAALADFVAKRPRSPASSAALRRLNGRRPGCRGAVRRRSTSNAPRSRISRSGVAGEARRSPHVDDIELLSLAPAYCVKSLRPGVARGIPCRLSGTDGDKRRD